MVGMEVCRDIASMRRVVQAARGLGRRIGFVPTMGALHRGHISLIEAAQRDAGFVLVSIFVNPTQFGPNEDYGRYPRDERGDLEKCRAAGAEAVFLPGVEEMYPGGARTTIHVSGLSETLCGRHRPGHFDGVATVVAKLFNIVRPDVAYFGRKDAQQLAIVRRMARDLDMGIEIVGCPIVREPDGLAMSSRNAYLAPEDRERATSIHGALLEGRRRILSGECDATSVRGAMMRVLSAGRPSTIDYVSVVDPETLAEVERVGGAVLLAIAAHFGTTRLIDNELVERAESQ